jgi:hypothetical protein
MVPQWWFGNPHWRPSEGRRSQWRSTVSSSCNQSAIEGRLEEEDNDNKEEEEDDDNEEKDGSAQEESLVDSELAYQVCSGIRRDAWTSTPAIHSAWIGSMARPRIVA